MRGVCRGAGVWACVYDVAESEGDTLYAEMLQCMNCCQLSSEKGRGDHQDIFIDLRMMQVFNALSSFDRKC